MISANSSALPANPLFTLDGLSSRTFIFWRILATLGLLAVTTAAEYELYFRVGFHFPSSIYVIGILLVATCFGTGCGIFFAVCSVLLCAYLFDGHPFSFQTNSDGNLATAFVFLSAAALIGMYADLVKQKFDSARILKSSRSFSRASQGNDSNLNSIWKSESQNIAVAILMVGCACIFTLGFHYIFDIERSLPFLVAAILITAITRGARAAMVAAIAAVMAFNALSSGLRLDIAIDTVGDLANLLIFSAIAWWVGGYADHVRHGRRMAQILFDASQILSTMSDERSIRRLLRKAVIEACGTSGVWVIDEEGKSLEGDGPPISPRGFFPSHKAKVTVRPLLRTQPLQVNDRALGTVIRFCPGSPRRDAVIVDRVVSVLADLTASAIVRARLTAEQTDMQMLAQAEKLRTALLSSISHDFRTPLSGILGAATGLLEQGDNYDKLRQRDLLLNIRNQAVRLNRYIENLLSMMQFESGALKVRPQILLVEPLVYDAWEALGDSGSSLRILDVRIQDDAIIFADQFLFTQALTNLFENAIKYTPEGSSVIVRGRTTGQSQLIEIVDAGPGVAEADLPQIFHRFYRGGRPVSVGLGLGLYITKALLEAMKASIEIRNRPDGKSGLIVSMTMPGRPN